MAEKLFQVVNFSKFIGLPLVQDKGIVPCPEYFLVDVGLSCFIFG
jgi:hypothetical protein